MCRENWNVDIAFLCIPPTHPLSREYLEWWKGLRSSRPFHCSGWSRKKGWLAEARPSITDQQVRYRQQGMYHPNDGNSDTGLGQQRENIQKGSFFLTFPIKSSFCKKKRPTQLEATKQSLRDALSGRISNISSPKGNSHILSAPIVEHSLIGFHPLLNTHF